MRLKGVGALAALAAAVAVFVVPASSAGGETDTYIVQFVQAPAATYDGGVAGYAATKAPKGEKFNGESTDSQRYSGYLQSKHDTALSRVGGADKLYDYTAVVNGFAARLTAVQAAKLETQKGVVSVEKAEIVKVDGAPSSSSSSSATTGSSDAFLGLSAKHGLWDRLGGVGRAGENVVVGVVDTGYWPENPAFADIKPGPASSGGNGQFNGEPKVKGFHGICQAGEDFPASTCNNKVIAARYFVEGYGAARVTPAEYLSPRDLEGHGSHTSSTAAGDWGVKATGDAAVFGTVSGLAPRARIAVYKACWLAGCSTADTTAAIDQAVADGVDVINYSISGTLTNFVNATEVAFLNAAAAGVFVTASAGNSGPAASSVAHPSPWIITTAAGTLNRDGKGTLTVGTTTYQGGSSALATVTGKLINSLDAKAATASNTAATLCDIGSLDPAKVTGKIVVCDRGVVARIDKSLTVKLAGGIGMVMVNPSTNSVNYDLHFVPTIHLNDPAFTAVHQAATDGKTATISKGTIVYDAPAPFTAVFSSRGPITAGGGDILKPDIIAPGQDVLAAVAPPGNHGRDFDLYSGTSMSSPHMAGLAALLKQAHPDWSPMMIKSAFMTTAYQSNDYSPFNWGAGHVDANKAVDPGLVFDSGINDWLAFLKGQKLCCASSTTIPALDASDLNSASIAIGDMAGTQTVTRTATSVAEQDERYTFSKVGLAGITATPSTSTLVAEGGAQSIPFTVTFAREAATPLSAYVTGFIVWTGNRGHVVKMAVAIKPVQFQAPTEVSATGATGSLTIPAKAGYSGTLGFAYRGLQAATMFVNHVGPDPACSFDSANPDSNVTAGHATVSLFSTPASGANLVRFQTFQSDAAAAAPDVDMFVYREAPAGSGTYALIGASGGPDANEVVTSTSGKSSAAGAKFRVYIHGCDITAATGADVTLFAWALSPTSSNPFTAAPATQTVSIGQIVPATFSWAGLPAGNRYLGRVVYSDGTTTMGNTVMAVSTR